MEPTPAPTMAARLGAFPPLPTGAVPNALGATLQSTLEAARTALHAPGIAAAVIAADHGSWAGAAGTADGATPLDAAAAFGIGSVTKTVVAAEVLRLAASGAIDLDRPIATYLGTDIPTNGATVRQVLGMRSGIGEATADGHTFCDADLAASVSMVQLREALSPDPLFPPGTRFRYTNANYVLAGLLIEAVTGGSVSHALRSGVLAAPGLERLVYQDAERPTGPLAAPFVVLPGVSPVPGPSELLRLGDGFLPARCLAAAAGPAGGMAADPMTLARWGYLLYGGSLLDQASLDRMVEMQDGYGLAAHDHSSVFGVPALGHEGTVPGYVTALLAFPDQALVVAVLVNTNDVDENALIGIAGRLRNAVVGWPGG